MIENQYCYQRPYQNLDHDVAHEADYESEDADFYPKSEKMQHYKKLGPIWIWAAVSMTFFFFFWVDFVYNHFPDELWHRKPRPPPLDFPDPISTPDTYQLQTAQTNEFKYAVDAGIFEKPPFKIVDGKKVYDRFAGVNQPMDVI